MTGAGVADNHALYRRDYEHPHGPGIRPRQVARHAEVSGFSLVLAHNSDGKVSFVLSGALKPAEGPPAG